jgi:hypothetical protein
MSWKPGRLPCGSRGLDQVDDQPGYIVALLADLHPQDAVGELEPDIGVAAQMVRQRGLAVAAGAAQRRGHRHRPVAARRQNRLLQPCIFGRARHEILGQIAGHVGHRARLPVAQQYLLQHLPALRVRDVENLGPAHPAGQVGAFQRGVGEHRTHHPPPLPRMGPFPLHPVGRERPARQDQHQMLRLFDRAQYLRTDIAAAHVLQVTPGPDAGVILEPALERFGEFAAVRARIGDEDPGRGLHGNTIGHPGRTRNKIHPMARFLVL